MRFSGLGWAHVAVSIAVAPALFAAVTVWLRGATARALDGCLFGLLTATDLTGFALPANGFGPAQALGVVVAGLLLAALPCEFRTRDARRSSLAFILLLLLAAVLDIVAGVVAAFQFIPPLTDIRPGVPAHLTFASLPLAFRNVPFLISAVLTAVGGIVVGIGVHRRRRMNPTRGDQRTAAR